eukprot:gene13614-16021_t
MAPKNWVQPHFLTGPLFLALPSSLKTRNCSPQPKVHGFQSCWEDSRWLSAGALTQSEIDIILGTHNQWRANPTPRAQTPIPSLKWSVTKAAGLQAHVDKCDGRYSPDLMYSISSEWKLTSSPSFNVNDSLNAIGAGMLTYNWDTYSCPQGQPCTWSLPTTNTPKPTATTKPSPPKPAADGTIDWRGYASGVRNQGGCGSCWAFSSIATLEARYAIKNNLVTSEAPDLSEQNFVNCVSGGCDGQWPATALKTMIAGGVSYEKDEPYQSVEEICVTEGNRFRWTSNGQVANNKEAFIQELRNGPFSVAVEATAEFSSYSSGIFSCITQTNSINHVVLLVGYNRAGDYWIVKNSWSRGWGEAGYGRMSASNDRCSWLKYKGDYAII